MRKLYYIFTILLVALVSLVSCKEKETPKPIEHYGTNNGRTMIMYMVAENSLSSYLSSDIDEILQSKMYIGPKDKVVLYVDDTALPRIYAIDYATEASKMGDLTPVKSFEEDVNSCDPQTLADVIKYATTNYPAPSYGLVLWSHASGWMPSDRKKTKKRTFGIDNGMNTQKDINNGMEITELDSALTWAGVHFDFILSDACFMQNIEIAYQLRTHTETCIGSPAEIPAPGAPYDVLLPHIFANDIDARGMARQIVNQYVGTYRIDSQYGALLSAIDCSKMEPFAQYMAGIVSDYRDRMLTMATDSILDYNMYGQWRNSYSDFYDMRGVMRRALMVEEVGAYEAWEREFSKILLESQCTDFWYSTYNKRNNACDKAQYSGVSMHLPLQKYSDSNSLFAKTFPELEWAKTVWMLPLR